MSQGWRASVGFTLLELLVVLTLIGLVSGFVLPGLSRMVESTQNSIDRHALLGNMSMLTYRAGINGMGFVLSNNTLKDILPDNQVLMSVPVGWKIEVTSPITYAFSGICSGGNVTVISPRGVRETVRLTAPACIPEADE